MGSTPRGYTLTNGVFWRQIAADRSGQPREFRNCPSCSVFGRPQTPKWPTACIPYEAMTKTSNAVGQRRTGRAPSVITPTPEKRQQRNDVGMGTVAVAFAGLALALMNYMF